MGEGCIAQCLAIMLLGLAAPGLNQGCNFFQNKIFDAAVLIDSTLIIQWEVKCLIKLTEHIQVLTSGKLVLQTSLISFNEGIALSLRL